MGYVVKAPQKASVVIYDSYLLQGMDAIVAEYRPFLYDVRGVNLYLSAGTLWAFGKRLWSSLATGNLKKVLSLRALKDEYRLAVFDYIDPKVVVTLADGDPSFYWLCDRSRNIEFIAIQNARRLPDMILRSLPAPADAPRVRLPHLYVFGQFEKDVIGEAGYDVSTVYPNGAWKLSDYMENGRPSIPTGHEFDLCLISQWRHEFFAQDVTEYVGKLAIGLKRLNDFLKQYLQETGKTMAIALRFDSKDEQAFFDEWFAKDVARIVNNQAEHSTYKTIDASRVVVGFYSSALYEGIGLGARGLICNYSGLAAGDPPVKPSFLTNEATYAAFKHALDDVFEMSDEQWRKASNEFREQLMNNRADRPVSADVKRRIDDALQVGQRA